MSMYDKNHYNTVISLQLIKINEKKNKEYGLDCHAFLQGIFQSRDLPNPGIKPMCFTSPALAGGFFTTLATWEAQGYRAY